MAEPSAEGSLSDGDDRNEVVLRGRVSGTPERRGLPSGDEVVGFRLVVRRPGGGLDTLPVQVGPAPGPGARRAPGQVGRRALTSAERLPAGTIVEVRGRLHRRWWATGAGRRSRLEVVADELVDLGEPAPSVVADAG